MATTTCVVAAIRDRQATLIARADTLLRETLRAEALPQALVVPADVPPGRVHYPVLVSVPSAIAMWPRLHSPTRVFLAIACLFVFMLVTSVVLTRLSVNRSVVRNLVLAAIVSAAIGFGLLGLVAWLSRW